MFDTFSDKIYICLVIFIYTFMYVYCILWHLKIYLRLNSWKKVNSTMNKICTDIVLSYLYGILWLSITDSVTSQHDIQIHHDRSCLSWESFWVNNPSTVCEGKDKDYSYFANIFLDSWLTSYEYQYFSPLHWRLGSGDSGISQQTSPNLHLSYRTMIQCCFTTHN